MHLHNSVNNSVESRAEQNLIALLRIALSDNGSCLDGYEPLSDADWQAVYNLAEEQGLDGVLFSAIEAIPKQSLPDLDLLIEWLGQTEYIKYENDQYRSEATEFIEILRKEGVELVVLKGMECAKYYPVPNRRPLGDLDIFPIVGTYDEVNSICAKSGFAVDFHDYKHSKILFKGLTIENHKYCTEIRGVKVKKEFEARLQELLFVRNTVQFNALFLMAHAFNHFLDEGLNLRQICDWAMFVKAEQDRIDWGEFYWWMERMHMNRFAQALNAIAAEEFRISFHNKCVVTSSDYKERILKDALYGNKHLHKHGLKGWRYRLAQIRNAFGESWKYRDICQQNVLVEYTKGVWYYFTERNPKI